jgi:hypothetical protein
MATHPTQFSFAECMNHNAKATVFPGDESHDYE